MVFPVGGAPDGNNPIGWSNAKDLYNGVQGNEAKFIELWSGSPDPKEKVADSYSASEIFGFLKSMDTDGKAGLSPEEYKAGLTEKKEDLEIKINNDWQQFSNYSDLDEFLKLSPTEQLASIKDWMLDLGIVTDILEADMEAMAWLNQWNHDKQKLAAIDNKLAEIADQENADTTAVDKQKQNDDIPAVGGSQSSLLAGQAVHEALNSVRTRIRELTEKTAPLTSEEEVELGLLLEQQAQLEKILSATNENVGGFDLQ